MRQVAQNYKSGTLELVDVPAPALLAGMVQVRTSYSLVSPGTEGMKVNEAKMSLLQKARARPDHVRQVLKTMRQQGVRSTYSKVMNKLDSLSPLGYSASGIIEAVGAGVEGFQVGQRVAIAGAGYANHAEVNVVPYRLCALVPEQVPLEHAAFTTMGMIALHGLRQGDLRLGEVAVIIGLGMVGQLLGQLACAAGMQVIGIDLDEARCDVARASGFIAAGKSGDAEVSEAIRRASGGAGADCVFLCLGTSSNQPLLDAISICRDRGRVVCVGLAKMDLPYNHSFKKEIEFRFSRSYGAGRYDPSYEEKGQDYPIGYVRWTEGRNMQAVLALMAQGKLHLDALITHRASFDTAPEFYEKMHAGELGGIGILFDYTQSPAREPVLSIAGKGKPKKANQLGIGCIGVGNYAASMLLPHLKSDKRVCLIEVANATALSSKNAADKFGFLRASTNAEALLGAEDCDALFIATRHSTHAALTLEALKAGKAVFVEKPLAITPAEMHAIAKQAAQTGAPRLHVGFNRRFAPIIQEMKACFPASAPLAMHYRVHAGALEASHWVRSPEEGGRFIGEAGHFFDVFAYLTGATPISIAAQRMQSAQQSDDDADNWAVQIRYDNGSIGTLHYLTQGGAQLPKEWLEVSGAGVSVQMDNFTQLSIYNGRRAVKTKGGYSNNKGQKQQLEAVLAAWCDSTKPMPISLQSLMHTNWLALIATESAARNQTLLVADYA